MHDLGAPPRVVVVIGALVVEGKTREIVTPLRGIEAISPILH
jgi:hypothetical protein